MRDLVRLTGHDEHEAPEVVHEVPEVVHEVRDLARVGSRLVREVPDLARLVS